MTCRVGYAPHYLPTPEDIERMKVEIRQEWGQPEVRKVGKREPEKFRQKKYNAMKRKAK